MLFYFIYDVSMQLRKEIEEIAADDRSLDKVIICLEMKLIGSSAF